MGPTSVNLVHDLFSPPDPICYGAYRGRNSLAAIERGQLPGRENRRRDQDDPLAAFIHLDMLPPFAFVSLWQ